MTKLHVVVAMAFLLGLTVTGLRFVHDLRESDQAEQMCALHRLRTAGEWGQHSCVDEQGRLYRWQALAAAQ